MIDYDKPVRMKSGKPVKILTTHLMGSYPVLGQTQGEYCLWKKDGSCLPDGYAPEDDLENVLEEREVWLHVYRDDVICVNSSRETADLKNGRIARLKINLRDVEGRFDE